MWEVFCLECFVNGRGRGRWNYPWMNVQYWQWYFLYADLATSVAHTFYWRAPSERVGGHFTRRGPQRQQELLKINNRKKHGKCRSPPHSSRRHSVSKLFVQDPKSLSGFQMKMLCRSSQKSSKSVRNLLKTLPKGARQQVASTAISHWSYTGNSSSATYFGRQFCLKQKSGVE